MTRISESTLLRWRREILSGKASKETQRKLVEYVRHLNRTTGFRPQKLMDAYYEVSHHFPMGD